MQFYELFVALNNYIGIVKTGITAFFPTYSRFGSKFAEGTFNHSELFGEWGLLSILFLLPISMAPYGTYNIRTQTIVIGMAVAFLNMLLSGSRSVFFLLLVAIVIYYVIANVYYYKLMIIGKNIRYLIIGAVFLVIMWEPLDLSFVIRRFTSPKHGIELADLRTANWVTGKGTPREDAFEYFFDRYRKEKSWLIGFGWGTPYYNRTAWFEDLNIVRADYHSLYLTIIITYGWIGSVAYLSLFLLTIIRLFSSAFRILRTGVNYYYFYPIVGFAFLFVFMLINEYKISLVRFSPYHSITWFWLGLANALVYNSKIITNESRMVSTISN